MVLTRAARADTERAVYAVTAPELESTLKSTVCSASLNESSEFESVVSF